tara:strand:+ start:4210 stop:4329 length:120 start_codon:yes stop_codon:yes gene_type:complete
MPSKYQERYAVIPLQRVQGSSETRLKYNKEKNEVRFNNK